MASVDADLCDPEPCRPPVSQCFGHTSTRATRATLRRSPTSGQVPQCREALQEGREQIRRKNLGAGDGDHSGPSTSHANLARSCCGQPIDELHNFTAPTAPSLPTPPRRDGIGPLCVLRGAPTTKREHLMSFGGVVYFGDVFILFSVFSSVTFN